MVFAFAYIDDIGTVSAGSGSQTLLSVAFCANPFAFSFPSMPSWPGTQCSEKVIFLISFLIFVNRFMLSLDFGRRMLRSAP